MVSVLSDAAATGLVLVSKRPAASKQRLRAVLGPLATQLAELMFHCALEDLNGWPGRCVIAAAGADDAAWFGEHGDGNPVIEQSTGNLGQRIMSVDRLLRDAGWERMLLIGLDCPTLSGAYLGRAAVALDNHDAVFGTAADGGVCVMGARCAWPDIADLPWSQPQLGSALENRCLALGFSTSRLPPLNDVDMVDDLAILAGELVDDVRPSRVALRQWLAEQHFG